MALKLAFTSCMDAEECPDQPVWDVIAQQQPDLLLLLGDQIYMDYRLSSLGRVPSYKRRSETDLERTLEAFADEMHMRYSAQWAVPSFQRLVCGLPGRGVLLAWDDHDFAWNNAYGCPSGEDRAPQSLNHRTVPPEFKCIAWALRSQYQQVLTSTPAGARYPCRPSLATMLCDAPAAVPPVRRHVGGIDLLVLDQRWCRTHRDASNRALLSCGDRALLLAEIARSDAGLLILAGSSPLKHHSIFGTHNAWWAPPDPDRSGHSLDRAYPEYQALVDGARRPILYLAGDIHRNGYGGWVEDEPSPGSHRPRAPIVQVLSSGASLGRLLFKEYAGGYGLVTMPGTAKDTDVTIELHTLDRPLPDVRQLRITGGHWSGFVPEGECTDPKLTRDADTRLALAIDHEPLTALVYRERGQRMRRLSQLELPVAELDDEAFTDALPAQMEPVPGLDWLHDTAEVVRVQASGPLVRIDRTASGARALERAQETMLRAFEQARRNRRSVVFFVHGFGKGFTGSLTQTCVLRDRFPCVPLLYSWPAASEGGLLGALGGFAVASSHASWGAKGLAAALAQFCQVAETYRGAVGAVVLARSLGSVALSAVADRLRDWPTAALRRVVLSAPACDGRQLAWLDDLRTQVVITGNRNDRTLRWADFLHTGALLGHAPATPPRRDCVYLDCTDVVGVEHAHDYLLRRVNAKLHRLNTALLAGERIDFEQPDVPGLRVLLPEAARA